MNLEFKEAQKEDVELITLLADRIWHKHYIDIISLEQINYMLDLMYSPSSLRRQMEDGQKFTLVYHEGTAIGYVSLSSKDNQNFFLHKFYIDAAKQGSGIGTALLRYLIKSMPTIKTIELTVNRQNYKSINFYFKNGFRIKKVADFDIGNGYVMNDFVMQLTV